MCGLQFYNYFTDLNHNDGLSKGLHFVEKLKSLTLIYIEVVLLKLYTFEIFPNYFGMLCVFRYSGHYTGI